MNSEELEEAESKEGLRYIRVESRERFRDKGIFGSFAMWWQKLLQSVRIWKLSVHNPPPLFVDH